MIPFDDRSVIWSANFQSARKNNKYSSSSAKNACPNLFFGQSLELYQFFAGFPSRWDGNRILKILSDLYTTTDVSCDGNLANKRESEYVRCDMIIVFRFEKEASLYYSPRD